jgi:hypothetical protein
MPHGTSPSVLLVPDPLNAAKNHGVMVSDAMSTLREAGKYMCLVPSVDEIEFFLDKRSVMQCLMQALNMRKQGNDGVVSKVVLLPTVHINISRKGKASPKAHVVKVRLFALT